MAGRERAFLEALRFAADIASDPSAVVTLWRSASGGKAVGCLPATPVPEPLSAAGLLPVVLESLEDRSLLSGRIDAWIFGPDPPPIPLPPENIPRFAFPRPPPENVEEALDRVESLAEWARAVSGSPASEGALWRSIRAHTHRRALLGALEERCARETGFLTPEERRDAVRAGNFLPAESHSRLLGAILGRDLDAAPTPPGGEKGDPLIVLANRLMAPRGFFR